uniref:mRNA m(6)A methyltransferase n=1 Tax=Trichobilharzia regenti TaxID=157069 RepID=A0AA85IZ50_TRIRE|nr:unnamed protein product [Trichobilharzia regenti]
MNKKAHGATTECSSLELVEAAKAKQISIRERLAARREFLASITNQTTKDINPASFLLTNNNWVGLFNKTFGVNSTAASLIEYAFKKIRLESHSTNVHETNPINNIQWNVPSVSEASNLPTDDSNSNENCPLDKSSLKVSTASLQQPNTTTNLPDSLKSTATQDSVTKQLSEQSKDHSQRKSDLGSEKKVTIPKHLRNDSTQDTRNKLTENKLKEDGQRIELELENLLGAETTREKESKRIREEVMELLNRQTTKERFLTERFRTQGGSQVQQFCSHGTRIECSKVKARTGDKEKCTKLHFRKIIHPHTDESLGDCSFLNTCFHVDTCKYVHYTIDYTGSIHASRSANNNSLNTGRNNNRVMNGNYETGKSQTSNAGSVDPTGATKENGAPLILYPPQWINCDIRLINMSILGKFSVIMADPPWDIHMELPYGTMSDDEMRRLDIPCLQDDGYIFLWVTGRAMELGRECLRLWGYERIDEIIWVKTNQLQRLIRTGRTGHWLNHGKEHCLVGVKGNPKGVNKGLDCDIIVSEVRETSHKPDEIYGIIERLSPGTRKLELFGRPHNLQPNWITLGNQLDGTYLVDPAVVERFKKQYPNGLDEKAK